MNGVEMITRADYLHYKALRHLTETEIKRMDDYMLEKKEHTNDNSNLDHSNS